MSLALVAVRAREAIIVTDGALTKIRVGGAQSRLRSDYPKFRAFTGGLAIASCGDSWMSERLYDDVGCFLDRSLRQSGIRHRATFAQVVKFLTEQLPVLHLESERRTQGQPIRPFIDLHGCNLVLVGFDTEAARLRMVVFSQPNAYQPYECFRETAIGVSVELAGPMLAAALESATWPALSRAMRRILGETSAARGDEQIGGITYTCRIATLHGGSTTCFVSSTETGGREFAVA